MALTGILPVDKPLGWTSHDVVARVRRIAGQRSVGHAGTLDPLATGLLLVMLGSATRLAPYLVGSEKEYRAELVLGATTATDDAEGRAQMFRSVSGITQANVETVLGRFVGDIDQIPPRYAAIKRGGEKLYVLARRGEVVQLEPRRVRIGEIAIDEWRSPRLRLRVRCGPGTYIRALARDIGVALGTGAYLHALRRTRSGRFTVAGAVHISDFREREEIERALFPPDWAVLDWPALVCNSDQADAVSHGRPVPIGDVAGPVRVYSQRGVLIALGEGGRGMVKPVRVFEADNARR